MVENKNELIFDDSNKPWSAPHSTLSLEGHWQPWYDDRRDYNTNAPTYYDYLSNFNGLIKSIVDFVNELAKRDVNTENTNTVELIKKTSWLVEGVNNCILKANVKLSKASGNKIIEKSDGLFVDTVNIDDLKKRVTTLEANYKTLQTTLQANYKTLQTTIETKFNTLNSALNSHKNDYNALKNRVDLLDGGGWATKAQLEELKKIIEANKNDYQSADSGLRLIIANMQKRLDALDGMQSEIDTWTEKVNTLKAEQLNVKNIATMASALVGAISTSGYSNTPVKTTNIVNKKDRFNCLYNSFTQRINGRITRIERIGFDFSGMTTSGATLNPNDWTKLGDFTKTELQGNYAGGVSNNLRTQINKYAFRYYQNYFHDPVNHLMYPWVLRLDYGKDGVFSVWCRSLKSISTSGDIVKPVTEEVYTVITWLDDGGNEYLPKYKTNGDPEELAKCERVTPITKTAEESALEEDEGITIVEHEGKKYFSDEFNQGNLNHPLNIPSYN